MDPSALDLRKLRAFQLAAKLGSLRRAAARLHVTVPGISFQIRRLEEELGATLFHRLPNSIVLTAAGEQLAREVDGIFEHVGRVVSGISNATVPSGRLSISTTSDLVWYFSPRISSFVRQHSAIDVSLHIYKSSETLSLVSRGELDVGVGYFPNVPRGLAREPVTESTLAVACLPGHPLLRNQPLRIADLARYRLLSLPRQSSTRKLIDRAFEEHGLESRGVIEAGNCQTAMEFAYRGVGIAIVHSLCAGHGNNKGLSYVDLGNQLGRVELSVIFQRAMRGSATIQALIEELLSRDVHDE